MPKVNLTKKPYADQIRIVKDYINRRGQHENQGPVTTLQIVKRFKHYRYNTDKAKYSYFDKILKYATGEWEFVYRPPKFRIDPENYKRDPYNKESNNTTRDSYTKDKDSFNVRESYKKDDSYTYKKYNDKKS